MVKIHLLYRLKVHATLWFTFVFFIRKVQEWSFCAVEHEPPFAPCFDAAAHFGHVSTAGGFGETDVFANVRIVAGGFYVSSEIKILAGIRQESCQRSWL